MTHEFMTIPRGLVIDPVLPGDRRNGAHTNNSDIEAFKSSRVPFRLFILGGAVQNYSVKIVSVIVKITLEVVHNVNYKELCLELVTGTKKV
jgi:hypothetical protein